MSFTSLSRVRAGAAVLSLLLAAGGGAQSLSPENAAWEESLKSAKIRNAVGRYLAKGEIDACLSRAALLVNEIESLIRRQGEGGVLY